MKDLILLTLLIFIFNSCSKDNELAGVTKKDTNSRTIIVYMVADNDLSDDAYTDIGEMQQGYEETGTKLVVFLDPFDDAPQILEIMRGGSKRVKVYSEFNSSDADQMGQVLKDIISLYRMAIIG